MLWHGLHEPFVRVHFCRWHFKLPTKTSRTDYEQLALASSAETLPIRLKSTSIAITCTIENLRQSTA